MGDRTGQQFGNYRLVRLLGRGGFAEVYLGEHRRLQTQAAIKVLLTSLAQGDEEDFLKEARIVANLEHPHIVRVLDFDVQDSMPFLVMSYAPNGNIRQRHGKGAVLPLPTVVDYVKQVASALQYAHNEKFIHRDIKPENILVGRHQELLLSDFGIALIAQSSRLQSTQEVAGTASYMAPEQFQGKPRLASDQYALGIIVYEWLCGMRPFHGSFTEIASQHLFVPPPPLREKLPDLPADVEQVVQTALAKDPAQRFASVQAFATALEHSSKQSQVFPSAPLKTENQPERPGSSNKMPSVGSDLLVSPSTPAPRPTETFTPPHHLPASPRLDTPQGPVSRPPLPLARPTVPVQPAKRSASAAPPISSNVQEHQSRQKVNRRKVITGLAVLVVAGGGIYWLNQSQLPAQVSSEGILRYTYKGHSATVYGVAWSPDGKRVASASDDGTVQVWNAADGSAPYTYKGHFNQVTSNTVNAVAWSPDGNRIVSAGSDETVQVWNAADGSAPYTYKGHSNAVNAVAWSPDGKRIASASSDGTVQVWNAADGSAPYTYQGHAGAVNSVAWSPDGKRIASASSDGTVQIWNAADGSAPYTYRKHTATVNGVAWSPDSKRIASASSDGTVQVWNAADGSASYTYKGHTNVVNGVVWSPDGKRIASASYDLTVQVWNAADGLAPYTYQDHTSSVFSVAWSPDGKWIASASGDQTVQVWSAG